MSERGKRYERVIMKTTYFMTHVPDTCGTPYTKSSMLCGSEVCKHKGAVCAGHWGVGGGRLFDVNILQFQLMSNSLSKFL